MKKCAMAIVALVAAGCVERVVVNHHFTSSGYQVKGIHGRYDYSEKKKLATLTTGEGFEQRVYSDTDLDGKPDQVKYQDETIRRTDDGTSAIFAKADEDFEVARARYDIPAIDKEWRAMPPDERARREDYFK